VSDQHARALHPVARAGFAGSASEYERGRPGYPQAAVDWLVERCGIAAGRTVVDLGAGTGKLTRLLVPTGACLLAVEPLDGMRAKLGEALPDVACVAGTAEEIPLETSTADAVTAGQAFHWFRVERAVPEIHRVLRAGGSLGLIWNVRDPDDPVQEEIERIVSRVRGDSPAAYTWGGDESAWREPLDGSPLFARSGEARFPHEQLVDANGLIDRIASVSFVAALPAERRDDVLAEVRELASSLGEPLRLGYTTAVYAYRRVEAQV
jgi:SAM-dependent methyltransferase